MIIKTTSKKLLIIIIILSLSLLFIRENMTIIRLPNLSNLNRKYWVGEKYNLLIKNYFKNKYEQIFIKSKYNLVNINLLSKQIMMKSSGRECLVIYSKIFKSYTCFNIYNTPNISFQEKTPIKLETKTKKKLILNIYDYPKSYIRYISNNPDMINVNKEGEITVIRPGIALISALGLDNKTATIKVVCIADNGLINNNILKQSNITQYNNLMIVAHPDDEVLWGGANIYKEKYYIVCVTNGYNPIRGNEFKKSLNFTKSGGLLLNYTGLQDKKTANWSEIERGMIKDLTLIINYKQWKKIVTHGPEGTTGHIHHKKLSNYVSKIAHKYNKFNILYYFSKFYRKNMVPKNLKMISKKELEYKLKEIEVYKSQKIAINKLWIHFLVYENLISASMWKNETL